MPLAVWKVLSEPCWLAFGNDWKTMCPISATICSLRSVWQFNYTAICIHVLLIYPSRITGNHYIERGITLLDLKFQFWIWYPLFSSFCSDMWLLFECPDIKPDCLIHLFLYVVEPCDGFLCTGSQECPDINPDCKIPLLHFCINKELRCNGLPNCGPFDDTDEEECKLNISQFC